MDFFIMDKQKYIKFDGMLINVNHIVLVNGTENYFDGNNIKIYLSNNYKIKILDADEALYEKIINFIINDTTDENVLYIDKEAEKM